MFRFYILLVSIPAATIYASPTGILAQSPNGTVYLAVPIALVLLLTLLVIIKHIFIKRRRSLPNHSSKETPCSSFSDDDPGSPYRSIDKTRAPPGFLVGLLGSPDWETILRPTHTDKSVYPRSSFMYQLHIASRRRYSSQSRASAVLNANGYVAEVNARQSMSTESSLIEHSSKQHQSASLEVAPPSKAHLESTPARPLRRFSLPAAMYRNITHSRSPSLSFRSVRARCAEGFGGLTPSMDKSLRLVHETKLPEMVLPLSPKLPGPILSYYIPGSSLSMGCAYPSWPSPLQSPPSFNHLEDSQLLVSSPRLRQNVVAPQPLKISHPRRLARKRGEDPSESITIIQHSISHADSSPTGILPHPTKPEVTRGTDPDNINLVSILRSPEPLKIRSASAQCNRNIPRKMSSKSRKSPAIGPSPLRAMILPDSSEANLVSSFGTGAFNKENTNPSNSVSAHSVYAQLGLGFPARHRRESLVNTKDGKISPDMPVHGDADILLNVIRDLVEETSEWDASLFVDENFKSMMRGSWIAPMPKSRATVVDPPYPEHSKADDNDIHQVHEHELTANISSVGIAC